MKFAIENLGKIQKSALDLNKITIVCGHNNTSKTHLSYAIYGYYKIFTNAFSQVMSEKERVAFRKSGKLEVPKTECNSIAKKIAEQFNAMFVEYLPNIYSVPEENLKKSKVTGIFNEIEPAALHRSLPAELNDKVYKITATDAGDSITIERESKSMKLTRGRSYLSRVGLDAILKKVLFSESMPRPFVITSERSGISIFQKELDINRNILIEQLIEKNTSGKGKGLPIEHYFFEEAFSRYPMPVKDNIDTIRDASAIRKQTSCLAGTSVLEFFDQILGGKFQEGESETRYSYLDCRRKRRWISVPLHFASSSSKTLLLFDLYLRNIAQKNDILIIDEPELNLHPFSQRMMARLIAMIANSGIQVLITTHSDYIIRELNILMMLGGNKEKSRDLVEQFNYSPDQVLDPSSVTAYIAEDTGEITKAAQGPFGLGVPSFDDTLADLNLIADTVFEKLSYDN